MMDEILRYYQNNYLKIFNAIKETRWRIFKIVEEGGICRQNKFQITTPDKLWKFIRQSRNPPKALYVSVSTFLNPHQNHGNFKQQKIMAKDGHYFYPKVGYLNADNILLNSDFFIDLDSPGELRIAQDDARKIIINLKNNINLKFRSVQFSGTKGIHLIYKFKKRKIKDLTERIKYHHNQKTKLANQILRLKLKTMDKNHINIIKNIYAVYAAPYSLKPNKNIVKPLDIDEFMNKGIYDILSIKPTRARKQIARDGQPDDKKGSNLVEATPSTQQYKDEEGASITSHPIFFKFIDNMVNGLRNNYITVLKIHKKKFKVKQLKELQRIYNLSDFYIAKIGDYIYAYNLKVLQFPRIVKIMRKAKASNISFFLTRKHCPIQISNAIYKNGDLANEIEYIGTLKSEYGLEDNHSRPHCNLFKVKYNNMVGREANNIGTMQVL